MMPNTPLPSAVEAIGNIPLVELSRLTGDLTRDLDGRILAKLDYLYL
jgi:cysteine synthase A